MSLSNDLISQFVKIGQTETKTQTKTNLLATVCQNTKYVQIDGSDTTTPIYTTSTLTEGDRVTVSIENHTAIVTGNLTNPSTTEVVVDGISANYATVGQLSSAVARIDTLETDNVTINGVLDSQTADITTLKTSKLNASDAKVTYATIDSLNSTNAVIQSLVVDTALADRLTAAEADIDNLETNKLTASAAAITYAKITDLDSTNANVTNLEANVSDINTLISAITQSANSITSSVSETYATKQDLSDDIAYAQSHTDLVEERVTTAETLIEQLSDCIAVLVTDANGESLMTQTDEGWTFSTAHIQSIVDTTSEGLDSLTNEMGDVNATVDALQQAVTDLGILNDYVKIGTYESEPCIELGESDSDFKLIITNTRIMFMEGTGVPAYINNQSLYIKKAIVEEELQQGEFVWKARSNGNLGLVWKGVSS